MLHSLRVFVLLLCSHLLRNPSSTWHDVPDLPKAAAQLLDEQFARFTTKVLKCSTSSDGETTKLLVALQDGQQVESVIMHYDTTGKRWELAWCMTCPVTLVRVGRACGGATRLTSG